MFVFLVVGVRPVSNHLSPRGSPQESGQKYWLEAGESVYCKIKELFPPTHMPPTGVSFLLMNQFEPVFIFAPVQGSADETLAGH